MDTYSEKLKATLIAAAARSTPLHRLANATARRIAGRHYVAALGVVLDADHVLLARHRFRGDEWGLPGGWVNRREDAAAACVREISEETGLSVAVVDVVATESHAAGDRPIAYGGLTIAFWCESKTKVDRRSSSPSAEIAELRWLDRASCGELVRGFQLVAIDAAFRRRAQRDGEANGPTTT